MVDQKELCSEASWCLCVSVMLVTGQLDDAGMTVVRTVSTSTHSVRTAFYTYRLSQCVRFISQRVLLLVAQAVRNG